MIKRVVSVLVNDQLRVKMNQVDADTRRALVDAAEQLHQLTGELLGDDVPHQRLIAAENFLCEYVENRLPPGFDVTLRMTGSECSLTLLDPDSNEIEIVGETHLSSIALAIEQALSFDPEANDGLRVEPEHASRPMTTDGAQRRKCGCVHDGDYEE